MRILTVGDDPELKTVIKEKLLRENCMVDSCNSGSAALDYLQLAEYDVVLMDFDATRKWASPFMRGAVFMA